MRFRKKPVVIEAMKVPPKWKGKTIPHDIAGLALWLGPGGPWRMTRDGGIDILTREGTMHASIGDWIIKGVMGEFYPCKPEIFAATYEAVD